TSESLGILPIPDDICDLSGMMKYIPSLDSGQKYLYLASHQGTQKPILPVHTPEERTLFRFFLHHEPLFTPCAGEPNWCAAVKLWNLKADREEFVYYKLVEHLKVYYTKWKGLSQIHDALSISADARKPLVSIIHDARRSINALPVP
ncbi:hypothetical protein AGABI2DRAFT_41826, partial [Agaricus bisporus var. bisporus H97]|uniref:hypothetical protein n=1 Tax=Agaricus bisporus var. bisporus (strain H97 / ATCC MYA-4626 / FGSC 10389) TaxID=936046 RepID=UPI00029F65B6